MLNRLFIPLWVAGSILLFLYSFTQVDLSLTLSEASIIQTVQKGFQYIGWFNRPLSTYLYIGIFAVLFLLYFRTLSLVHRKKLTSKKLWTTVLLVTGILMISYNAFSYDLFNYIFDARIVSFYHENPYIHKALDYPGDPMLSFMHWTHRTYPYGPLWLVMTVPITFVFGNFFIVTFYIFKILMAAFFILTVYFIGKIAKVLKFEDPLIPVAAFALNPFILTESLVSAHNDIVMMGLAMMGTYYILRKERLKGSVFYILSASIKFATALIIIGYFIILGLKKEKYFLLLSLILTIAAVILATLRTTFQPWYLLYAAPFAVILINKYYVRIPFFIFSIAGIIYNIPYLYFGVWDPPVPELLNWILITALLVSVTGVVIESFKKHV